MSKAAPTPLVMPAIARKGDAAPAVTSIAEQIDVQLEASQPRNLSRVLATIAVTVRLDENRYERTKSWGTGRRVTNQEIIVAALDRFFALSDEEREEAIMRVRRGGGL
jgi:hypothetical protein